MNLVTLSDLHGKLSVVARMAGDLARADVVLLVGDITQFGGEQEVSRIIAQLRSRTDALVLGVAGNCDRAGVEDWLAAESMSLHGRHVVHEGVAFLGCGMSLPCPGKTPGETTEEGLADVLARATDHLDVSLPKVLVCHQPPKGTKVDAVAAGNHVGSLAVRGFIEREEPVLVVTGHIHEARCVDTLGPTTIVNAGPASAGNLARIAVEGRKARAELAQI